MVYTSTFLSPSVTFFCFYIIDALLCNTNRNLSVPIQYKPYYKMLRNKVKRNTNHHPTHHPKWVLWTHAYLWSTLVLLKAPSRIIIKWLLHHGNYGHVQIFKQFYGNMQAPKMLPDFVFVKARINLPSRKPPFHYHCRQI